MGRRDLLALTAAAAAAVLAPLPVVGLPAAATPLAPLGRAERVGGEKLVGLDPQQVADILGRNLREGQYFITGDLTPEVFADDCRFKDPTDDTRGLSRYLKALGLLFDAGASAVRLAGIRVTGPSTIEADWVLGGYLRLPWHPRVEPFEGHTVYVLDPATGLVAEQLQTWSISPGEALRETFTPTAGVRTDIRDLP